jgi:hypothetical protein
MKKFVVVIMFFITIFSSFAPVLEWDFNSEPNVLGYRVYWGQQSRNYTEVVDVSNVNTWAFTNANPITFYAVTAYDDVGLESEFSDEVAYIPATQQLKLQVRIDKNKCPEFYFNAKSNVTYYVDTAYEINDQTIWYPYTNLSSSFDGALTIPIYGDSLNKLFFRVFYNKNP